MLRAATVAEVPNRHWSAYANAKAKKINRKKSMLQTKRIVKFSECFCLLGNMK